MFSSVIYSKPTAFRLPVSIISNIPRPTFWSFHCSFSSLNPVGAAQIFSPYFQVRSRQVLLIPHANSSQAVYFASKESDFLTNIIRGTATNLRVPAVAAPQLPESVALLSHFDIVLENAARFGHYWHIPITSFQILNVEIRVLVTCKHYLSVEVIDKLMPHFDTSVCENYW